MKILMLVNWKIEYTSSVPENKQPPDYYIKGEPYWFFRHFDNVPDVDVVDIKTLPPIEAFEKSIHFYIAQTLKVIPKLKEYDVILSHGMQSAVVLSLWRRIFKTKAKHIVFEIGSFNTAAESGAALKLMQFASKSIDGFIYHTKSQLDYYRRFYPWIVDRCYYIPFGTTVDYFSPEKCSNREDKNSYMLCIGISARDLKTLTQAYKLIDTDVKLYIVGGRIPEYEKIDGIKMIPRVSINEMSDIIYNARLCILPLESYNFSYAQMTLMHQMALEKCVITARVPSMVDYIEDGKTAVLYEAKNTGSLAECIQRLLNNPQEAESIGKAARKYLLESCNEKIMAREIEKTIQIITE